MLLLWISGNWILIRNVVVIYLCINYKQETPEWLLLKMKFETFRPLFPAFSLKWRIAVYKVLILMGERFWFTSYSILW